MMKQIRTRDLTGKKQIANSAVYLVIRRKVVIKRNKQRIGEYNTEIKEFVPEQLSIYAGIPTPKERWEAIKITYYWKLLKLKELSYMHKWAKLRHIKYHKLYEKEQRRIIVNQAFGRKYF